MNEKEIFDLLSKELNNILEAVHDDVLITDGNGIVIRISSSFESVYGLKNSQAIGKSIYELEKKGYFKPSIVAEVLKCQEKVTMRQKNKYDRDIVVTAIPVRDQNGGIKLVISFSRDITDYMLLQQQYSQLEDKVSRYEEELEKLRNSTGELDEAVARDSNSKEIIRTIKRIAPYDANVLITGESGVGKTMFARILHKNSKRAKGAFVEINCGAIPENLLESELFGYEKGSFTGAGKDGKPGLIEVAHNGTLFLDEISELPINLQVKILKVIQDKTITRVGGIKEIQVDFRLIAASNKNLNESILQKDFREDLYYRLNVISIHIPPLRERREDIAPLINTFVQKYNEKHDLKKIISEAVYNRLIKYDWPGNIRELENVVERILLVAEGSLIKEEVLPEYIKGAPQLISWEKDMSENLDKIMETVEGHYIKKAYETCGTTVGVAKLLGISQPTAVRKIKKYVLKKEV